MSNNSDPSPLEKWLRSASVRDLLVTRLVAYLKICTRRLSMDGDRWYSCSMIDAVCFLRSVVCSMLESTQGMMADGSRPTCYRSSCVPMLLTLIRWLVDCVVGSRNPVQCGKLQCEVRLSCRLVHAKGPYTHLHQDGREVYSGPTNALRLQTFLRNCMPQLIPRLSLHGLSCCAVLGLSNATPTQHAAYPSAVAGTTHPSAALPDQKSAPHQPAVSLALLKAASHTATPQHDLQRTLCACPTIERLCSHGMNAWLCTRCHAHFTGSLVIWLLQCMLREGWIGSCSLPIAQPGGDATVESPEHKKIHEQHSKSRQRTPGSCHVSCTADAHGTATHTLLAAIYSLNLTDTCFALRVRFAAPKTARKRRETADASAGRKSGTDTPRAPADGRGICKNLEVTSWAEAVRSLPQFVRWLFQYGDGWGSLHDCPCNSESCDLTDSSISAGVEGQTSSDTSGTAPLCDPHQTVHHRSLTAARASPALHEMVRLVGAHALLGRYKQQIKHIQYTAPRRGTFIRCFSQTANIPRTPVSESLSMDRNLGTQRHLTEHSTDGSDRGSKHADMKAVLPVHPAVLKAVRADGVLHRVSNPQARCTPMNGDRITHLRSVAALSHSAGGPSGTDKRTRPQTSPTPNSHGVQCSALLYRHQVSALRAIMLDKTSVFIGTATGSGKSLCYQLPILQMFMEGRRPRRTQRAPTAMLIYPTKALAQDQVQNLRKYYQRMMQHLRDMYGEQQPMRVPAALGTLACYDGDTPTQRRAAVRGTVRVMCTNFDMLHLSILPAHRLLARFLAGLRYIVVDETHMYHSVFGGHVAWILRRLLRICAREYRTVPQIIGTSATVGAPERFASSLFFCYPPPSVAAQRNVSPPTHTQQTQRDSQLTRMRQLLKRVAPVVMSVNFARQSATDHRKTEPDSISQSGRRARVAWCRMALCALQFVCAPSRRLQIFQHDDSAQNERVQVVWQPAVIGEETGRDQVLSALRDHHHNTPDTVRWTILQQARDNIDSKESGSALSPSGNKTQAVEAQHDISSSTAGSSIVDTSTATDTSGTDTANHTPYSMLDRQRHMVRQFSFQHAAESGVMTEGEVRRSAHVTCAWLGAYAVCEGGRIKALCFGRVRKVAELIFAHCQRLLAYGRVGDPPPGRPPAPPALKALMRRLRAYRAGYSTKERRFVEMGMRRGDFHFVCCTSALEVGLDLGHLQMTVHCGFPSAVSYVQQLGRCGRYQPRSTHDPQPFGISVLVCYDSPLDRWICRHPRQLFGGASPHEDTCIRLDTSQTDVTVDTSAVGQSSSHLPDKACRTATSLLSDKACAMEASPMQFDYRLNAGSDVTRPTPNITGDKTSHPPPTLQPRLPTRALSTQEQQGVIVPIQRTQPDSFMQRALALGLRIAVDNPHIAMLHVMCAVHEYCHPGEGDGRLDIFDGLFFGTYPSIALAEVCCGVFEHATQGTPPSDPWLRNAALLWKELSSLPALSGHQIYPVIQDLQRTGWLQYMDPCYTPAEGTAQMGPTGPGFPLARYYGVCAVWTGHLENHVHAAVRYEGTMSSSCEAADVVEICHGRSHQPTVGSQLPRRHSGLTRPLTEGTRTVSRMGSAKPVGGDVLSPSPARFVNIRTIHPVSYKIMDFTQQYRKAEAQCSRYLFHAIAQGSEARVNPEDSFFLDALLAERTVEQLAQIAPVIDFCEGDRAFFLVHPGAIYLNKGRSYIVLALSVPRCFALVVRVTRDISKLMHRAATTEHNVQLSHTHNVVPAGDLAAQLAGDASVSAPIKAINYHTMIRDRTIVKVLNQYRCVWHWETAEDAQYKVPSDQGMPESCAESIQQDTNPQDTGTPTRAEQPSSPDNTREPHGSRHAGRKRARSTWESQPHGSPLRFKLHRGMQRTPMSGRAFFSTGGQTTCPVDLLPPPIQRAIQGFGERAGGFFKEVPVSPTEKKKKKKENPLTVDPIASPTAQSQQPRPSEHTIPNDSTTHPSADTAHSSTDSTATRSLTLRGGTSPRGQPHNLHLFDASEPSPAPPQDWQSEDAWSDLDTDSVSSLDYVTRSLRVFHVRRLGLMREGDAVWSLRTHESGDAGPDRDASESRGIASEDHKTGSKLKMSSERKVPVRVYGSLRTTPTAAPVSNDHQGHQASENTQSRPPVCCSPVEQRRLSLLTRHAYLGTVEVTTSVYGYWRIANRGKGGRGAPRRGMSPAEPVPLDLPRLVRVTTATWLNLPAQLVAAAHRTLQEYGCTRDQAVLLVRGGMHALSHCLVKMAPMHALVSEGELWCECPSEHEREVRVGGIAGGLGSVWAGRPLRVMLYETTPGGLGAHLALFPQWSAMLKAAVEAIGDCPCETGCPACVHSTRCAERNEVVNKDMGWYIAKWFGQGGQLDLQPTEEVKDE